MNKKVKEYNKVQHLRVENKIWTEFNNLKPRDKSWNLFIKELLDIIKHFKSL